MENYIESFQICGVKLKKIMPSLLGPIKGKVTSSPPGFEPGAAGWENCLPLFIYV